MNPSSSPDDRAAASVEVTCALCATTAPALPLGWSTSIERGVTVHHCERCSRENVRAMESKLDPQWW